MLVAASLDVQSKTGVSIYPTESLNRNVSSNVHLKLYARVDVEFFLFNRVVLTFFRYMPCAIKQEESYLSKKFQTAVRGR